MQILSRPGRRRPMTVLLEAALACAVICIAAAMLYQTRQTIRAGAIQSADNIASTLQRDIERNIDIVDLGLRNAQASIARLAHSNMTAEQQRAILFNGPMTWDHFSAMLVVDEHGRALVDTSSANPTQFNDFEREWFIAHRDNAGLGLLMTLIPRGVLIGKPVIILSRRLEHADGSFAGTISASIQMSLFEDLFGSLKLMPADDVGLLTNDGRSIFRRSLGTAEFGADLTGSPMFRAMKGGAKPIFEARSLAGIERLYSQRQLRNLPLTVLVGLSERNIYALWWVEAGTVGALVAVALWLLSLLRRELLRSSAVASEARQSEARYRFLADNTSDIVTCLDRNLRRTYVSSACRAVLGYEPEEMLGANPAGAIHPDDLEHAQTRFRRLLSGEVEGERATNRFRHKLGHWIWVEANLALVRDPATGEPSSIICSIRDISARKAQADELLNANAKLAQVMKRLEEARDAAEEASRAKSRFLASITHELRTPLNGILGFAELLRIEGGLTPSQTGRVEAMMAAGQHLLDMINSVLDLTEVETGHVQLRQSITDPQTLAALCLNLVRPSAAAKALSLTLDVAAEPVRSILVDATRLRQILLNLLGNAVKFTAAGAVTLGIRMHGRTRLRFEVADTGPGIAAHQQHRLFRDFERLEIDSPVQIEGAGLGLALSSRLADIMGGSLGYKDNPSGGSIFWLELPCVFAGSEQPPSPAFNDEGKVLSAAHVLVVDDVAANRDIAASFLRAAGHHVVCAEDGAEAVALASATVFDVILLDVRMPRMSGLDACRRIRALGGAYGAVPIVAMTAQAFTQHVQECREAGMDGHVSKPFTQAALLQSVAAATSRGAGARPAQIGAAEAGGEPEMVVAGADRAIFDQAAFAETALHLAPDRLASSVRALVRRTEELLDLLRAEPHDREAISAAAHSLAGTAGMFGFERLSAVGQQLEYAIRNDLAPLPLIIGSLAAAAEASAEEMRRLVARLHKNVTA